MPVCPKCGNEMREGEAFVQVSISEYQTNPTTGMLGMPGVNMPPVETHQEQSVLWREEIGPKGGLFRRARARVVRLRGMRCVQCGYIELYAQE